MRLHYFCATCWTKLPHDEEFGPMRLKHRCCFCMRRAKHWAKTDATTRKVCEPGHLKKGRFEKVFDRAARAHAEDAERIVAEESPLYGMAREPGAE